MLRALGNPTRLALARGLLQGPCTVTMVETTSRCASRTYPRIWRNSVMRDRERGTTVAEHDLQPRRRRATPTGRSAARRLRWRAGHAPGRAAAPVDATTASGRGLRPDRCGMSLPFHPGQALAGGAVIGLSAGTLLLSIGRIAECGGIAGAATRPPRRRHRVTGSLRAGSAAGPVLLELSTGQSVTMQISASIPVVIRAGFWSGSAPGSVRAAPAATASAGSRAC